jgi:hypothetical protein
MGCIASLINTNLRGIPLAGSLAVSKASVFIIGTPIDFSHSIV